MLGNPWGTVTGSVFGSECSLASLASPTTVNYSFPSSAFQFHSALFFLLPLLALEGSDVEVANTVRNIVCVSRPHPSLSTANFLRLSCRVLSGTSSDQFSTLLSLKRCHQKLLCAFVLSRLNTAGCLKYLHSKLQKFLNSASRSAYVSLTLQSLHWLCLVYHSFA